MQVPFFGTNSYGLLERHVDETWITGVFAGDILIRSTNGDRFYTTDAMVTLNISASVPVTVIVHTRYGFPSDLP